MRSMDIQYTFSKQFKEQEEKHQSTSNGAGQTEK